MLAKKLLVHSRQVKVAPHIDHTFSIQQGSLWICPGYQEPFPSLGWITAYCNGTSTVIQKIAKKQISSESLQKSEKSSKRVPENKILETTASYNFRMTAVSFRVDGSAPKKSNMFTENILQASLWPHSSELLRYLSVAQGQQTPRHWPTIQ